MIEILNSLFSGDIIKIISSILASVVIVFTALPIHEFAHGWMAYKLGDHTAKNQGRLDLNPFSHFDLIGTTCLLLFGFGWAKPVPVNPFFFKNRKNGMALTALAGPVSNILVATIALVIKKIIFYTAISMGGISTFISILLLVIDYIVQINLMLAAFNMLPIPPLDGSKIIAFFMPMHVYGRVENWFLRYQQYIFYAMIAVFFILPRAGGPFAQILSVPVEFLKGIIYFAIDFLTSFIDLIAKLL